MQIERNVTFCRVSTAPRSVVFLSLYYTIHTYCYIPLSHLQEISEKFYRQNVFGFSLDHQKLVCYEELYMNDTDGVFSILRLKPQPLKIKNI